MDNRKLSVEVCEMIIKWELYRLKQSQEAELSQVGAADWSVDQMDQSSIVVLESNRRRMSSAASIAFGNTSA